MYNPSLLSYMLTSSFQTKQPSSGWSCQDSYLTMFRTWVWLIIAIHTTSSLNLESLFRVFCSPEWGYSGMSDAIAPSDPLRLRKIGLSPACRFHKRILVLRQPARCSFDVLFGMLINLNSFFLTNSNEMNIWLGLRGLETTVEARSFHSSAKFYSLDFL